MGIFGQDKSNDEKKARAGTTDGKLSPEDRHIATPHARPAEPLVEGEKHDQLADKAAEAEDRQEALLDEGIEESFPASDPVSAKRIT